MPFVFNVKKKLAFFPENTQRSLHDSEKIIFETDENKLVQWEEKSMETERKGS